MSNRTRLLGILFALALELLIPLSAHAQWIEGDSISVCTAPGNQTNFCSTSDGHGGVITAWLDCRNGCYEIYVQRIDSLGYARWGIDGVLAAGESPDKTNLVIVGDGAGGAIIAWVDRTQDRTGAMSLNVYAQKIDASGNLTAALTGKPICTAENDQRWLRMVPDGSGGAIAAWTDRRRFNPAYPHYGASDVYGEHIDHDGNTTWGSTRLVLGEREASLKSLISDKRGGVILSYMMSWPGSYADYMARISSGGGSLWTLELTGDQVISNGAGGAIVTWNSEEGTMGQWIDSAGAAHWGGMTILPGMNRSDGVPDGKGGAIFMAPGIVQRINSNGARSWSPPEGVNIEVDGPLIADGFGGAIVGTTAVQRVDSSGNVVWRPGGEPTVAGSVTHLVSDGAGGVILVFGSEDIYAQRVNPATRSPILAAIGDRSLEVGETVVIQLSATVRTRATFSFFRRTRRASFRHLPNSTRTPDCSHGLPRRGKKEIIWSRSG